MFLRVLVDDVTSALNEDPKWADYWESSVKTNVYSPDLLRHIVDKLTFITVPKQPSSMGGNRYIAMGCSRFYGRDTQGKIERFARRQRSRG